MSDNLFIVLARAEVKPSLPYGWLIIPVKCNITSANILVQLTVVFWHISMIFRTCSQPIMLVSRCALKRMDWNKAFPETNFNFEDEDIRIEKTVKTLTKVCVKVK